MSKKFYGNVGLAAGLLIPLTVTGSFRIAQAAMTVECSPLGNGVKYGETCQIHEPIVTQKTSDYPQIVLKAGDQIYFTAHGCVQTGGSGKTWKLWLNPQGPNSGSLYHGTINIPGVTNGFESLEKYNAKYLTIPRNVAGQFPLQLGYQDDNYGDNGYWGHDDGTGNQCKNVENAWLDIQINHAQK